LIVALARWLGQEAGVKRECLVQPFVATDEAATGRLLECAGRRWVEERRQSRLQFCFGVSCAFRAVEEVGIIRQTAIGPGQRVNLVMQQGSPRITLGELQALGAGLQ